MTNITADDLEDLRHMLGAEPGRYSRKSWGFRNYFVGRTPSMDRLCAVGFVRQARPPMNGNDPIYAATREGCRAAGMTVAEIDRMENQP